MSYLSIKPSGPARQLVAFAKTDELTQLLDESSRQLVLIQSEIKNQNRLRSVCAASSWLLAQSSFGVRPRSFASFGSVPKEGGQTFRSVCNLSQLDWLAS